MDKASAFVIACRLFDGFGVCVLRVAGLWSAGAFFEKNRLMENG
jgi:hypothetical protein